MRTKRDERQQRAYAGFRPDEREFVVWDVRVARELPIRGKDNREVVRSDTKERVVLDDLHAGVEER